MLLELDRTQVILDRGVYRELVNTAVARTSRSCTDVGVEVGAVSRGATTRRPGATDPHAAAGVAVATGVAGFIPTTAACRAPNASGLSLGGLE